MKEQFKEFYEEFSQNKGAVLGLYFVITFLAVAIFAPLLAPYDPSTIHSGKLNLPAFWNEGGSFSFILGTDDVGRDTLSRLIYGARVSMTVGFMIVIFSTLSGVILGLLAGYFGGRVEKFIMRCMDLLMSLPSILLAIVIIAIMGNGQLNAILAVSIVGLPGMTRIVRASVLSEKKKQYVLAAQTYGASSPTIMVSEILPNCMAPIVVQATLTFSDGILNVAALSFLGLGVQPPTPEWGVMLSDARAYIESNPLLVTLPGLCIMIVVLGLNLLGDGLRDALDPKLKR